MMRPRKQPITKHNSSFWEITLARICNRLQIPEHARTASRDQRRRRGEMFDGTPVAELERYT
jgi:hypothetical protein